MMQAFAAGDRGALILMLLIVFGLGAVLVVAVDLFGGSNKTDKRVNAIRARWRPAVADEMGQIRRTETDSSFASLDRMIKRLLPNPEQLRRRLARTGKKIKLAEYILAALVTGASLGALVQRTLDAPFLVALLVAVGTGALFPHMFVGYLIRRRLRLFTDQFPEAIDLIVRGLRSGLPATESMKNVGEEMPAPVGVEFKAVIDAVRVGQTLEDALWDVAQRLDTPEFKFFIVALSVQRETGGNLAETLENLSDVLRKRRQMKKKIKALASEPKASAWILGSLPFLMFGLISAINLGYVSQLFTDPRGPYLIAAGLTSQAIGVAVMIKMVNFEI